jgi:hypothetical protein
MGFQIPDIPDSFAISSSRQQRVEVISIQGRFIYAEVSYPFIEESFAAVFSSPDGFVQQ